MTALTAGTCRHCNEPADGQDGFCCECRAKAACIELTENVSNALEIFLDARYSPHEEPEYYRKSPSFDDKDAPELTEITAACEQVTAGVKRLIELALGNKVEMDAGPWQDFYGRGCGYSGWHAAWSGGTKDEAK